MTMITPSYLGETIEYSSLHACRSTLEDPTDVSRVELLVASDTPPYQTVFAEQSTLDTLLPFADRSLQVLPSDAYELNSKVVECAFCAASRLWKPLLVRVDKKYANHISVAKATVENVEENITLSELCESFSSSNKQHHKPQLL